MGALAIEVANVGKHYRLGQRESYRSIRDSLANVAAAPGRLMARLSGRAGASRSADDDFWALKDVSFRVEPGEVVGIIGRNGAGKSTLLKILSRITMPTTGRITMRGRVGSLLEVGTGFHPELTGRENIYLNGAILGMKRAEIQRRYDEIVAFAEVEKFLETPVKHYSSGMYMRLAFSVAAHLEPEILLVDEVLAVGDAAFQRKCLNKMEAVGKHGRTVFFVSHNMPAITRLCPRAIMLDRGTVYRDGSAPEVVSAYLSSGLGTIAHREWPNGSEAPGNEIVRLRAVRAHINDGQLSQTFDVRTPITLEIDYDVLTPGRVLSPNFHVYNEDGTCLFVAIDSSPEWRRTPRPAGRYRTMALIPGNFLAEGTHVVHVAISTFQPLSVHFNERDAVAFQVIDRMEGESARGDYAGHLPGVLRPLLEWKTTIVEQS